jgi:diguanylate cyclase (GGDEF)-like protein
MSFRTRLTSFFILIVVVPMIAVGFLVLRLISDSERGKTDARGNGVLSAAVSLYRSDSLAASSDARAITRNLGSQVQDRAASAALIRASVSALTGQSGLARVVVRDGARTLADVGSQTAIAPGSATLRGRPITVVASEITAAQYVHELAAPGVVVVLREGSRLLAAGRANVPSGVPAQGPVSLHGNTYRALSQALSGFGRSPVELTVLSSVSATAGSVAGSRVLALVFIVAFLLLALSFSVLASKGLQGQVSRFLHAARRLAGGDFSSPIRIEGRDEFAALGEEFNNMSTQLEQRLDELSQERARLREAIRRIGQTFASNLDRQALLELALKTAIDAVGATGGRVSVKGAAAEPLTEALREGSLTGTESAVGEAERGAVASGELDDCGDARQQAVSVPLVSSQSGGQLLGLITVVRQGESFSAEDRELLRSLAAQATLALENVALHVQVSRQAVTDELTGLVNHGRFQELLGLEIEQVRRYHYPIGLIMVDIDNFKLVNDTYGHQQGDVVLKRVARVLADSSREVDYPARYGGEEMAVILPHTDLEGSYAIAERIRTSIEALRIPRTDNQGMLRITASLGVAASGEGQKDALIAQADAALYQAKHQGKNRTVRAPLEPANVFSGE